MVSNDTSSIYLLTRELGNGIWFTLSICMAAAFAIYGARTLLSWREWKEGPWAVFAAFSLCLFFIASGIRAGSMWTAWLVSPAGTIPAPWMSSTAAYVASTILGVVAVGACMAVFNSWRVWLPAIAMSIGIPVAVYFVRNWPV